MTSRHEKDLTAAEAFAPSTPIRTRERRRARWAAVLAVLVLVVLGFASYKLVSGAGRGTPSAAAGKPAVRRSAHASVSAVSASASASTGQASTGQASASASPAATATPSAAAPAARTLTPVTVTAFGPDGTADGDNPQEAAQALAGDPAVPWNTDWYATADFDGVQAGTGLLIDMGHQVTVSSVQVSLAGRHGGRVALRAGAKPVPSWLPQVAAASGADGTVRWQLASPAHVRYLLVWFTALPPDAAGTYQAAIDRITVKGQP